jgi:hypothetical protein
MKRNHLLVVVALLALCGGVVAAFGTAAERDRNLFGYANPSLDATLPFAVPQFGVNADLTAYNAAELQDQLARMSEIGVTWVRQRFTWSAFAADPTDNAETYDGIITAISQHPTLRLIVVLEDASGELPDMDAYAQAAATFARRYGEIIDIYQIWDEPNLGATWGGEPQVTEYAALLSASYNAIHSNDPQATVLSAALAPTLETGRTNISDLLYLDALYALGLRDFSDGIAAKPYGFDAPPNAPPDADQLNFNRLLLLRDIMLRHEDGQTALWASEWGWNILPTDWTGDPSIWGSVTADQQAAYTLTTLHTAAERYPWLAGMTLSHWQPAAQPAESGRWGFALRSQDDAPTALYSALQTRAAAQAADGASIGLHAPANPYARYSGVWTFGDLGADIGWVGDSSVEFTFAGEALSLLVREGNYTAYLYITVDGADANALPTDADGNSYLLLTSDNLTPQVRLVTVARELGDGVHTVRIVADRGWDQWALVGFAVGGRDLAQPYNRQIALAALASTLAGVTLVISLRQLSWLALGDALRRIMQPLSNVTTLAISLIASLVMMVGLILTWRDATPDILRREPIQLALALISGGLLYLSPAFVVSIVAALFLFVIFFHKPLYGLALTLLFAPLFLFPVELYRFAFPISELLVLLTFTAWALRQAVDWATRRKSGTAAAIPLRWHIIDLMLLGYLTLGTLSLVWTEYRALAFTELRTLFVEPLLFYVVLRTTQPTQRDILRLIDALVISAVVVAGIGLFLYLRGDAIITAEDGARRLASVYGSPNNVALWLGRALPFALAFLLAPLDRTRRLIMGITSVLLLVTLALTLSAGAFFFGIPAALIVVIALTYRRRALLPLVGLGAAGAAALPVLAQFPRFARLLEPTDGTNFFRIRVWQSAVAAIRDHPITGIGQDQFLNLFRGRYILPDAWQEPNLSHPHNFLLDIWLRVGIAGVLLMTTFVAIMIRSFWRGYATLRAQADGALLAAIAIGGLGALANTFAHGLIDNSLFVNDLIFVFILLAGLAVWFDQQR